MYNINWLPSVEVSTYDNLNLDKLAKRPTPMALKQLLEINETPKYLEQRMNMTPVHEYHPVLNKFTIWAPSSDFVSSSIPSWQILTAHAQPFRGARDLAFCLKVPLDSLLIWASSEGSGETARMRRLAWTFAARIGYKYQNRLTRSIYTFCIMVFNSLWVILEGIFPVKKPRNQTDIWQRLKGNLQPTFEYIW